MNFHLTSWPPCSSTPYQFLASYFGTPKYQCFCGGGTMVHPRSIQQFPQTQTLNGLSKEIYCNFIYLHKFSSMNFIIKRVTITVVILGAVYIICWTPYWVGIYAHYFIKIPMSKPSKCSFRINFPLIRIFCSNLSICRADCNVLYPSATLCNVCCISNNIHSSQPSDSG